MIHWSELLSWVEMLRDVQAEKEERMSGAVLSRWTVTIQVTLLGSKSDAPEESSQKCADLEEKLLLDVHQERQGRYSLQKNKTRWRIWRSSWRIHRRNLRSSRTCTNSEKKISNPWTSSTALKEQQVPLQNISLSSSSSCLHLTDLYHSRFPNISFSNSNLNII